LEVRFHKRQVSFLVVKTVKCKRGMKLSIQLWTVQRLHSITNVLL